MNKKIVYILLNLLILVLLILPNLLVLAASNKARPLEINYPEIPGRFKINSQTVAVGISEYVKYMFYFAVAISGFILFAVLVYNGFVYLTSAGDPTKLSQAKNGILNGVIGVIVLLAGVLIFNTINPQLVNLQVAEIPGSRCFASPGFYICNYNPSNIGTNIGTVLQNYLSEDPETVNQACEDLAEIMSPTGNTNNKCWRVNSSGDLEESITPDYYFFTLPFVFPKPEGGLTFSDGFGIILHKNLMGTGKIAYGASYQEGDSYEVKYGSIGSDLSTKLGGLDLKDFTAHSITYFEKPKASVMVPEAKLTLYSCPNYNNPNECMIKGETTTATSIELAGPTGPEVFKIYSGSGQGEGGLNGLYQNTRSLRIEPKDYLIAVLGNADLIENSDTVNVFTNNVIDLSKYPIGLCGEGCAQSWWFRMLPYYSLDKCVPCISSVLLIRGQIIR